MKMMNVQLVNVSFKVVQTGISMLRYSEGLKFIREWQIISAPKIFSPSSEAFAQLHVTIKMKSGKFCFEQLIETYFFV